MPGSTPPRSPRRPAARPRLGLERLETRDNPATDILTTPFGNAAPIPEGGDVIGASADGRYVIFQTSATNVIQFQENPFPGVTNVFWRDTFTGETLLVSAEKFSQGRRAVGAVPSVPGQTATAVISADGQSVAFTSTRNANTFTSIIISPEADEPDERGTFFDNGDSSADIFYFNAPLIRQAYTIPEDFTNSPGSDEYFLISSEAGGITVIDDTDPDLFFGTAVGFTSSASNPAISADGRYVTYVTNRDANQVAPGVLDNADNTPDIFGFLFADISVDADGFSFSALFGICQSFYIDPVFGSATAFGRVGSFLQVDPLGRYLSADGRSLTFVSNLSPSLIDTGAPVSPAGSIEVYHLRVDSRGVPDPIPDQSFIPTVTLITSAPGLTDVSVGARAFNAILPQGNPNTVVFSATVPGGPAGSLVPGYVNQNGGNAELYSRTIIGVDDDRVFVFDFSTDPPTIIRVPVGVVGPATLLTSQAGSVTNGQNGLLDLSVGSFTVDRDGTTVAFTSTATNLVTATDSNGANDVFFRPISGGTTRLASATPSGAAAGNGPSSSPRLNNDGTILAFTSLATNLAPLVVDLNQATDVFVRNLSQGRTALASGAPGATRTGDARSFAPLIGGRSTGGTVFFNSQATNLIEGFTAPPATDQGYSVSYPLIQAGAGGVVAVSGGVSGQAALATFNADGSLNVGASVTPFPGFNGAVRVASADVTGDGTPDLIVGAGPGAGPAVKVYDGATGALIYSFFPFESTFTGGVYVAGADLDGDGRAEVIVGAGENGGPRVKIFSGANGATLADLFVFEAGFRGGVRVAAGDINGDGVSDLIVGAGLGGGPRVTVFSGVGLAAGTLTPIVDIFVFEPSVRNGVYVGAGDANFDGQADLIVGGGPGGAPRVRVFDADLLLAPVAGNPGTLADFFAFPSTARDGVRVALRTIDGMAGIVAGIGAGGPQIRTFNLGSLAGPVAPAQLFNGFAFDETVGTSGAWVG